MGVVNQNQIGTGIGEAARAFAVPEKGKQDEFVTPMHLQDHHVGLFFELPNTGNRAVVVL